MLSNKTPMNLQYFAEEGSQSNNGQAGSGESGNPAGQSNGTQNNGKTGDQSNSQNFMEGIIKKALAGAPSNQQQTQTQNNGKTGDQPKPNNEPSNNNLPKTQAELDALITKRVSREYQKGLDDGKKSGMTEAQRLASMTDDQRAQEERNKVLQENNKLKAQIARQGMQTEVESQVSDSGYSLKPDEISSLLIGDNAEQTKAKVSLFNSMMERNITKAKQDLYKGNAPKSNGGTVQKTNIGEEIAKKFSTNDDRFKGLFFDKKNI